MSQNPWPQYAKSIPQLFFDRAAKWGDHVAIRYKRNGKWNDLTWRELHDRSLDVAASLLSENLPPRSVIAMISHNRPEWFYVDFGSQSIDVINVPVYPTNTADQIAFILEDSGAEIVFVEDAGQLAKIQAVRQRLPKVRRIVVFDPADTGEPDVVDLASFMERGRASLHLPAIEKRRQAIDPEKAATLIYTSGTTGNPKGVMLCHRNLISNIDAVQDFLTMDAGDSDLQFLPICHAFGRMEVYVFLMNHGTVNFAESIEKMSENFKEIRPLIFVTVPRMLEKVYEKIIVGLETASPVKRTLFRWAIAVGKRDTADRAARRPSPIHIRLQHALAERLVYAKVKEALGGHIRVLGYAAAPLALEIQEFFAALGITALEAYGLTETSPGLTGNSPHDFRLGSVGKPIRDTQIKIAPDGEVLARGPQVMLGYWNNPEATAEALADGWFHTGDIGKIDADGFLYITDRKKDLIITAGGKNVAPQNIENLIKLDPAIEQVAVIGDRRSYLVALVVPSDGWLATFAAANKMPGGKKEWVADPRVHAEIERRLAAANRQLAKYETIKRFAVLAEEFTVDNNMLTPTMKVRRKNVMGRYAELIDSLYH